MFTGIVDDLGTVVSFDAGRLVIGATGHPAVGESLAVNGACLTVVGVADGTVAFDVSGETLARTALGRLEPGDRVNLERPLTLLARLGGHLVQGHVDGVGRIVAVEPEPDGGARIGVRLPRALLTYVVEKGSLALDGVSLTVAAIEDDVIEVALIPHTLAATTFGQARVGDPVNVEVDVVAKYVANAVERSLGERGSAIVEGAGR
jgi:riboflavin synthase